MSRGRQTAFSFFDEHSPTRSPAPRVARSQPERPLPAAPVPPALIEVKRQQLEHSIAANLPSVGLALAVTDNRHTMISVKRDKRVYRLRLHHMFLDAGPDVVRALGRYVGHNDRNASQLLGRFIEVNQHLIRRALRRTPREVTLESKGQVHDLSEYFAALNRKYFGGAIVARITWGQRNPPNARRRRRRSIKMGSYSVEDSLIRVHPSLDRAFVPRYFVEWIVYHEMLHQKHDIPVVAGRRRFHTPAFLADEAAFEQYNRARRWERDNLTRLLAY